MRAGAGLLAIAAIAAIAAMAACTYGDPIVDEGFKCDDSHTCDVGQTCIAGSCRNGVGLVFFGGWQNRTETGCDQNALVDRDYGTAPPADTGFLDTPMFPDLCGSSNGSPAAEVIDDMTGPRGAPTRMLRVRQSTGHVNGTAFTVGRTLSAPQADFYAAWSVMYSPDWQWATADHAMFIVGEGVGEIAFGVVGRGDGSPGFVRIHLNSVDARFDATEAQLSVGVWHFCEVHVVSGPGGKVEARVDGVPVPFPAVNESGQSILDIDTGAPVAGGRVDTTYNDGAFLDARMSPTAPWFAYYDDVRMGAGIGFAP